MFGKKSEQEEDATIALSQSEVDNLFKKPAPVVQKKAVSKETEAKIKLMKEKTKAAQKRIEKESNAPKSAAKKTAAKKSASKKTVEKPKTSVRKKTASAAASSPKKAVSKLSVYYDGKLYGTAAVRVKNGKKIVELLTIRKAK